MHSCLHERSRPHCHNASCNLKVKQLGGLCLPQQRAEGGAHVDLEALDTKEIPSKRICI